MACIWERLFGMVCGQFNFSFFGKHYRLVCTFVGLVLLILFVVPEGVSADELRIIDQVGLSRAIMMIEKPANVVIEVSSNGGSSNREIVCKLIHSEGLAPDHNGEWISSKSIVFKNIIPGTWRIEIVGGNFMVESVRIE